jgi:hypothetical protein
MFLNRLSAIRRLLTAAAFRPSAPGKSTHARVGVILDETVDRHLEVGATLR